MAMPDGSALSRQQRRVRIPSGLPPSTPCQGLVREGRQPHHLRPGTRRVHIRERRRARAASIASATTLATGQLNKSDQLDVELHRPADLPAFILVKWPSAPSVAGPDTRDLVRDVPLGR